MKMKSDSTEKKSIYQRLKNIISSFYTKFRKLIIIFLILFLVMFLILTIFNLTYNLHFYKNPKISIEPTQIYKTLKNNESELINFTVSSRTNFLCKSTCSYEFIDRSLSIALSKNILNKSGFVTEKISGPGIGSGVFVYNLEVTCKNEKSLYCPYDYLNESSKKSSFVVLSYDLTDDEKNIKEEIRPKLLNLIQDLNKVDSQIENINLILNDGSIHFFNKNKLKSEFNNINKSVNKLIINTNLYYTLFEEQKYLNISSNNLNENAEKLSIYSEKLLEKEKEINLSKKLTADFILRYNYDLVKINNLSNESKSELNSKILPEEINKIQLNLNEQVIKLNLLLLNMSDINTITFQRELEKFESNIELLEYQISNFKKNIFDIKQTVLKEEYDKRCFIGYCPTFSADFCENINQIMQNESYVKYELKNEIYSYNNTYYNQDGVLNYCNELENKTCIFNQTIYVKYISENQSLNYNLSELNIIYLNKSIYQITENKNKTKINIEIKLNLNLENISENLCTQNQNQIISNFSFYEYNSYNLNFNNTKNELFKTELVEHLPMCCQNGICASCCMTLDCKNDEKTYPLLLVHGHSFLRSSPADPISDMFNKIEYQLIVNGYIDGGTLEFEKEESYNKDWSYLNLPIVLKTNYYYESYYNLGSYVYIVKNDENIDNYAIRLSENIENVKKMTGRPKVNIVAHSMGGLVVRRYIQIFGENSVNKVILIATPNHGIEGRVEYLCSVVGEKLECEDMKKDSIILSKLNAPNYIPKNVKIYTISGSGCDTSDKDGDGIVTLNSSMLTYSQKSYIINGTCSDLLSTELHAKLLDIDIYPEVYENILEILKE